MRPFKSDSWNYSKSHFIPQWNTQQIKRQIYYSTCRNVHLFKDLSNHFFHNGSSSKYFSKHTLILFSMPIPWYCQENDLHKCKKGKDSLFPGTRESTWYTIHLYVLLCLNWISLFYFDLLLEFGVHLAELTVDRTGALAIRQVRYFIPYVKSTLF